MLGVEPAGLVDRMFGGMGLDHAMVDGVRAARAAGLRTGLLSNSWGDDRYAHDVIDELFDDQVISSEVGLRKPDPAIYALAAERLGLPAEACVFVDDLPGNLKPARALGMATVVHRGDARRRSPRWASWSDRAQPGSTDHPWMTRRRGPSRVD